MKQAGNSECVDNKRGRNARSISTPHCQKNPKGKSTATGLAASLSLADLSQSRQQVLIDRRLYLCKPAGHPQALEKLVDGLSHLAPILQLTERKDDQVILIAFVELNKCLDISLFQVLQEPRLLGMLCHFHGLLFWVKGKPPFGDSKKEGWS
jgi:hypothetical protein